MPRVASASDHALLVEALETVEGPCLVLDARLRIVASSRGAEAELGRAIPRGAAAPHLFCGPRAKGPLASALRAGKRIDTTLVLPGGDGRRVRVGAIPLAREGGYLLTLVHVVGNPEEALFHGMWSRAPAMQQLFRMIERVGAEDVPVLVRGETGAGKELVARAVHGCSPRARGPFRAINCAALPTNLLESELFGHAKGAFTGAIRDVRGHVVLADGGTLFLDEVAELPLELQAKLLRVLETKSVVPVGARDPVPVDVRFVSATHRGLRREVEAGRFRADLMYRLRVVPLFLPPLRERVEDIPLLVDRLVAAMNPVRRRKITSVSAAALDVLARYAFPGNVRELQNVLAYAFVVGDGERLEVSHLPPEVVGADLAGAGSAPLGDREHGLDEVRDALARTRGNRAEAARLLGISRVTLWRRLRELGLEPRRRRAEPPIGGR